MRQNLAELLASAVSTTYGTYYGTVISALATRSRANCSELIKALPELSSGDVRLALVTLVQQHLINHHTDEFGATYYEPNWDNAYNFTCRLPTLHKFMENRFDSKVAEIFDSIAQSGVVTVGDLLAVNLPKLAEKPAQDAKDKHDTPNAKASTNGIAKTNGVEAPQASGEQKKELHTVEAPQVSAEQKKELYGALNLLLATGYIMRVNMRQFWPPHDRETEAIGEIILAKFPAGTSAKKERDALQEESSKLLRKWRDEDDSFVPPTVAASAKNGRKRSLTPAFPDFGDDSEARPSKRRQLNGQLPTTVGQYRAWLSEHHEPLDVS
jgi:hypothetical protein